MARGSGPCGSRPPGRFPENPASVHASLPLVPAILGGVESKPRLVTLHELARYLRLKPSWLRGEADADRIPCLRAGSRRLFNLEAVEKALLERAAEPGGGRDGP